MTIPPLLNVFYPFQTFLLTKLQWLLVLLSPVWLEEQVQKIEKNVQ